MADRKMSEFEELTASGLAEADFLPVLDASAGATAGGNKKISLASLKTFLQTNLIPWITANRWVTESRIDTGAVSLRTLSGQVLEKLQEAGIKGLWSAASGSFPSGAVAGDQYIVTVAGTVGGQAFSVGDTLLALVNSPSTSVYAANWLKVTRFVIERGSNANGDYVKFSDGTMICTHRMSEVSTTIATASSQGGGFRMTNPGVWTYPAAFAAMPRVTASIVNGTAFGVMLGTIGATTADWYATAVTSQAAATRTVDLIAVGRWF